MRKHVISGLLLAVAVGLCLPPGFGKVKAEDGAFPPDMLKAPVLIPAPEETLLKAAVLADDSVTQTEAPAQPFALTDPTPPAGRSTVLASTESAKTHVKKYVVSKVPAASAAKPVANARLAHRAHARHRALHARRLPLPPVKVVSAPRPAVQGVQTASASCAGFCGRYVLVGVGF